MSGQHFVILSLLAIGYLSCAVSSTVLVFGKHTDNTCAIRGDWAYIKAIDDTIKDVFPEIDNRGAFSLVDIRKSPTEVLDLFIRYNYKVASANTIGQETLWTLQKRRDK